MLKIKVDRYDENGLEKALRKFKRIDEEVRLDMEKHLYYVKPGLKLKLKSKEAQRRKQLYEIKRNKWQSSRNY